MHIPVEARQYTGLQMRRRMSVFGRNKRRITDLADSLRSVHSPVKWDSCLPARAMLQHRWGVLGSTPPKGRRVK